MKFEFWFGLIYLTFFILFLVYYVFYINPPKIKVDVGIDLSNIRGDN